MVTSRLSIPLVCVDGVIYLGLGAPSVLLCRSSLPTPSFPLRTGLRTRELRRLLLQTLQLQVWFSPENTWQNRSFLSAPPPSNFLRQLLPFTTTECLPNGRATHPGNGVRVLVDLLPCSIDYLRGCAGSAYLSAGFGHARTEFRSLL